MDGSRRGALEAGAYGGPQQLAHVYYVVTPADIIRNGGTYVINDVGLSDFIIRGGFPCRIKLDDTPIASRNDCTPLWRVRRHVSRIEISLHGNAGGLTDSDAYGQHAALFIEGAPAGDKFSPLEALLPDSERQPIHNWQTFASHASGQVFKQWTSDPRTLFLVAGRLPKEVWIHSMAVRRVTDTSTWQPNSALWEVGIVKFNTPAGDQESLIKLVLSPHLETYVLSDDTIVSTWYANAGYFTFSKPLHFELASYGAQYAAETPLLQFNAYTSSNPSGTTSVVVDFNGSYRF